MSQRSETFGRLLKGAINSIAAYEGKAALVVEDELGAQIGVTGASIQRYKAGYLPPDPRPVQILAEAGVRRGFLARAWLTRFLQAARYPTADTLIASLADAFGSVAPATRDGLPSGTVALLLTDIAGSTRRWEEQPQAMERALERHDALLRQAIDAYGGHVFKTVGDAVFAVFTTAPAALDAALAAQRSLQAEEWGPTGPLLVRMALHVGAPQLRDGDYFGPPMNRAARLLAAGHGGQILLSLSAQELVYDALPPGVVVRDLGEHRLKDLGRPERIFQLVAPDLPAAFPPLQALDSYRHNLPSQPTPLVGREAEVAQVCALLRRDETRLVTLIGPGGIGKTRLSLQVAVELLDSYPDGVTFVALAPVREVGQVAGTIVQALGLQAAPDLEPLAQLKVALASRQALLLLDNVEQVIAAAPLVAELLAAAPGVQILATSRTPLRLQGEQEVVVPPLALADTQALPPLERLAQIEAVRLFIERAQAVRPDFAVTAENAPVIAEICVRLDGLPLAIELAAARTKLFAPTALLARLDRRLQLLRGGARDLPARQQTLYDAIAWSYDLLDVAEQLLFARLAVFVGGCSLEAAEAVLGDDGANPERMAGVIPTSDVLEGLARLVDRSLVRRVEGEGGEPRFVLLETIREFAQERLAASGEEALIQTRHARWVLTLMKQADSHLRGPEQQVWYRRLLVEQANLRAALHWLFSRGDSSIGTAITGASWWFWCVQDHVIEGKRWLSHAIATGGGGLRDRAAVLTGSGYLLLGAPEHGLATGIAPLAEARSLWAQLGEPAWEAFCLLVAGLLEQFGNDDSAQARRLMGEGVALAERIGDPWMRYYAELCVGLLSHTNGDRQTAQAHFAASLAYGRASGDQTSVALALHYLARYGDAPIPQRLAWAEEAVAVARELGFPLVIRQGLEILAELYSHMGRLAEAARVFEQSTGIAHHQGVTGEGHVLVLGKAWLALQEGNLAGAEGLYRVGIAAAITEQCRYHQWLGLADLVQLAAGQGRYEAAATCYGAANQLYSTAMEAELQSRLGFDEAIRVTRAALGEEGWARAVAAGQALSPDEVCGHVLGEGSDQPLVRT